MGEEFVNRRSIQWFPGHMMKTLRLIESDVKNVDAVLQLLDARIPYSSLNPELQRLVKHKPRLYVLNKADLADPAVTAKWTSWFKKQGAGCVSISSKTKGAAATVRAQIEKELAELIARRAEKGTQGASIRVMVLGIPNVGKSTFINCWAGTAKAKAADRPGVTRGKQWISVAGYELLDMPGVLWKKFESLEVATNLAFIGSIKDNILDIEELAMGLLSQIKTMYPDRLLERYKLKEEDLQLDAWDLLEAIGRKRGMLISGGEVNTERAAIMVVDEFRASKWGRITLEQPPVENSEEEQHGIESL